MIVDETDPMTSEGDSGMPEAAALTRVAIKRRKAASADGTEAPKKSRKQADSTTGPGGGAKIKRGRKAALVFDDATPTTPAAQHAAGKPANIAQPVTSESWPEPTQTAPDVAESPVTFESLAQSSETAPEVDTRPIDLAEHSMPIDISVETLPEPKFGSDADEGMPAEAAPAIETATPLPETEHAPEQQWHSEAASESAMAAPADNESSSDFHEALEPTLATPAVDEQLDGSQDNPDTDVPSAQRSSASRFEAIARAARMSALSTAHPGIAKTIAADAARSAEARKRTTEIFGYWVRAKNGRRFPSRSDFEASKVGEFWPNSMLLTCGVDPPAGGNHVAFSKVVRLDNGNGQSANEFNFSSMIIEWILTIGGEAARVGQPVQDTEVFPSSDGAHAYKVVALPLGDHQSQVDHVLCHLTRS